MATEKTILIIDDDEIYGLLVSEQLHQVGYDCHVALDVDTGKRLVESLVPAAVLLDLDIAGHSGFEFIKFCRIHAALRTIPVIVLSSHQEPFLVHHALNQGADDYLFKNSCDIKACLEQHTTSCKWLLYA